MKDQKIDKIMDIQTLSRQIGYNYHKNAFVLIGKSFSNFTGQIYVEFQTEIIKQGGSQKLNAQQIQKEDNQGQLSLTEIIDQKSQRLNQPNIKKQQDSRNQDRIILKFPKYNKDKLFYTPAFVISQEPILSKKYYQRFMSVISRSIKQASQIVIYEPRRISRHDKCAACRQNYTQYLSHIRSSSHKSIIEKLTATKYIKNLQELMKLQIQSKKNDLSAQSKKKDLILNQRKKQQNSQKNKQIQLQKEIRFKTKQQKNNEKWLKFKTKVGFNLSIKDKTLQRQPSQIKNIPILKSMKDIRSKGYYQFI